MKHLLLSTIFLLCVYINYAQEDKGKADLPSGMTKQQELSVKAANPLAIVYKFIAMNNTNFGDQTTNTLYIEPVIPVILTEKLKLINFAMIPIDTRHISDGGTETSLGNISYSALLSNNKPIKLGKGGIAVGVGPAVLLQSNTYNETKSPNDDTWNIGGAVMVGYKSKGFMALAAYTPTFGVGGAKVDYTTVQYIINYSFKTGTSLGTSPLLLKNDGFTGDGKWLVPFGGGGSQIFKLFNTIMNGGVSVYYNAIRPDVMKENKWY